MTPFADPLTAIFEEQELSAHFSTAAALTDFTAVEWAIAEAGEAFGAVSPAARRAFEASLTGFSPDIGAMRAASVRDGLSVPEFVAQLKAAAGDGAPAVHVHSTSQDVMDTATAMALSRCNAEIELRLAAVTEQLVDLAAEFGEARLMGRTRMQAALPVRARQRIVAWALPLARQRDRFGAVREGVECVSLGGAVGDRAGWGAEADAVAAHMASRLGLHAAPVWHTARDGVLTYGGWLATTAAALGKIGTDVSLMALQGIDEMKVAGGGGSSAMPHKANPVAAEALTTLAQYQAGLSAALVASGVHEMERSGVSWMLERMVLPQMVLATGRGLALAHMLLQQVERIGAAGEGS